MSQYRIIASVIIAVVLTGLLTWFSADYVDLRQAREQNVQRGQVIQRTAALVTDGEKVEEQQTAVEQDVQQAVPVYRNIYTEAKRNDPIVSDRADRAVPDSVRRAYRERRLARERSSRAARERAQDPEAEDAAER